MPRTGTSVLQWHLFSRHSEICYLGMYLGKIAPGHRRFDHCRDGAVQAIMREIGFDRVATPDYVGCRRRLEEVLSDREVRHKVPVWSWESLSTDAWPSRRKRAVNLREVFGPCRIIVTVRNPFDLVHSVYFQILRRENVARPRRFKQLLQATYYTMENWLEREFDTGEISHHLDYARTIQLYADVFGRDAVRVQTFEAFRDDPRGYVQDICEFMGVDPVEGQELTAGRRENSRFSSKQYATLQGASTSALRAMRFRLVNSDACQRLCGVANVGETAREPAARATIPEEWRRRIAEVTSAGNRWLRAEWNLSLGDYGYPL